MLKKKGGGNILHRGFILCLRQKKGGSCCQGLVKLSRGRMGWGDWNIQAGYGKVWKGKESKGKQESWDMITSCIESQRDGIRLLWKFILLLIQAETRCWGHSTKKITHWYILFFCKVIRKVTNKTDQTIVKASLGNSLWLTGWMHCEICKDTLL